MIFLCLFENVSFNIKGSTHHSINMLWFMSMCVYLCLSILIITINPMGHKRSNHKRLSAGWRMNLSSRNSVQITATARPQSANSVSTCVSHQSNAAPIMIVYRYVVK